MNLNKIEKYLEEVFEEKMIIEEYLKSNQIPLFLANEYDFSIVKIHGHICTLMKLNSDRIITEKIIKNIKKLEEIDQNKKVLVIDELRSSQRKNLVRNRIPFIVPGIQIYLPFIFLDFKEAIIKKINAVEKFTIGQQLVYLSILRQEKDEVLPLKLVEKLNLSMSSVNRAVRQLVELELLVEVGKSTRKKYYRIKRLEYWLKGCTYLISPVQRIEYIKDLPSGISSFISYDSGLSKISMLVESKIVTFAIYKKEFEKVSRKLVLKDYELDSMNYFRIEVWKYDPGLFSKTDIVDVFSLYAVYKGEDDPRVDKELEKLIRMELCEV